uniref:Putative portal protein n=1 Tax=viral metagenome TaxID=1070528 RepID=A0A6M3M6I0_9ZZZZ
MERGASALSPMAAAVPPRMDITAYLNSATGWVYACVSAIADEVANVNIRLYRRKGDDVEEVFESPILDFIYKVNSFTTKFDHLWLTQLYLELSGEAPWLIERGENNIPTSMYLLRPDKIEIIFDKETIIGGYKYDVGPGNTVFFDREDIIFLRYPHPLKPFRGRGTLEAALATYNLDKYSEEWNEQFFFNSARPDAMLTTDQKLTDSQRSMLKEQWDKNFRGIAKHAKLVVLENGLDYKILQLSQKDMEFLAQQKFSRDKILSIFRVPKPIIAITEEVNRSNAEVAAYSFSRWTIKPKMTKLIEQLNEFLIPLFPDSEDLYLDFDDPVPENMELNIKQYHEALGPSGWMTINEVRERENLPPVDGGDVVYRPFSETVVAGTEEAMEEQEPEEEEEEEEEEKPEEENPEEEKPEEEEVAKGALKGIGFPIRKGVEKREFNAKLITLNARNAKSKKFVEIKEEIKKVIKAHLKSGKKSRKKARRVVVKKGVLKERPAAEKAKASIDEIERERFWNKQIMIEEKYEKVFIGKVNTLFREQKEETLEKLDSQNRKCLGRANQMEDVLRRKTFFDGMKMSIPTILLKVVEESRKFRVVLSPIITSLIKESGQFAIDEVVPEREFDMKDKDVEMFLDTQVIKFSSEVNRTTNKRIRQELKEGISKGEGVDLLRKRIELVFEEATKERALMIARTETARAAGFGTVEAYRQSGVVSGKQWLTAFDERTCEWCGAMNGEIVELDDNYFEKGDVFTGRDGGKLDVGYGAVDYPPLHPNCRCTIIPVIKEG